MAKFVFQMESILSLKEKIATQKEREFAKAMQILNTQRGILAGYFREKDTTIAKLRGELGVKITPVEFKTYTNYIEATKKWIEIQKKEVTKAENFVEKKRLELLEATKEKKMLEKLRENKMEEYIADEKKAEQKVVDEVVSYRFKPENAVIL